MRQKLALIFGTPIVIALLLAAIYYSKVYQGDHPISYFIKEWFESHPK